MTATRDARVRGLGRVLGCDVARLTRVDRPHAIAMLRDVGAGYLDVLDLAVRSAHTAERAQVWWTQVTTTQSCGWVWRGSTR